MTLSQPEYLTSEVSAKYKIKNLVGKQFEKLTVVSLFGRDARKQILWSCICSCGADRLAKGGDLKNGSVTACGVCTGGKGRPLNLVGKKFGRLTVVSRADNSPEQKTRWLCKCSCKPGKTCVVLSGSLVNGTTRSCGCYMLECFLARSTKHGQSKRSGRTRAYSIWADMVKRCTNPAMWAWEYYGGRGITVCEPWLDFNNFFKSMGYPPPGKTLDRLENNLGYCPENCAWVSRRRQSENRRISKNNKTGHKGVYVSGNRYCAGITTRGKKIRLGRFPLTEEGLQKAVAARLLAEDIYFGGID